MHRLLAVSLVFLLSCQNTQIDDAFLDEISNPAAATAIKIMSAPGGAGSEINLATLNDAEPLNLFAISVTDAGDFIEDVSVTWSLTNSLGSLSNTVGTSTTFTPGYDLGAEVITANESDLGSDSTGNLAITYSITSVGDVLGWYLADAVTGVANGANVLTWKDYSGSGYDATGNGGVTFDSSVPAINFDGGASYFEMNAMSASLAGGDTISYLVVMKTNYAAGSDFDNVILALNNAGANTLISGTNSAGGITLYNGATGQVRNAGLNDGNYHLLELIMPNGGIAASWANGVQSPVYTLAATLANLAITDQVSIGQEFDGAGTSGHFTGDIAEIAIFKKEMSGVERTAVYNYFKAKYPTLITITVP